MYLNTVHEYFYMYYKAFSLFCRAVWPLPGDGKLFISREVLNSALGVRECKRGSLCIIQLLYIQASDTYVQSCIEAHIQLQLHRKPTFIRETSTDVSLFVIGETKSVRKEKREIC